MLQVSGFIGIGLIVIVWLVVLAPLLLRSQKPIRKAGEAFEDTRVILEGGDTVPTRLRPLIAGTDTTGAQPEEDEDYEIVDSPGLFRNRRESADEIPVVRTGVSTPEELDDAPERGEPVAEVAAPEEDRVEDAETPEPEQSGQELAEDAYPVDEAYTTPLDQLHPAARTRAEAEYGEAFREDPTPPGAEVEEELTAEDVEFAERRRGRGYYDPVADDEFSRSQYRRRQRTLAGLGIAVVFTLILGFIIGGGAWWLPAVAAGMTVLYLVALRQQVRAENELRARRIRRLRRSRMGVRHSEDLPPRLRRPGAVVLELDDESPDFENLPNRLHAVRETEQPPRRPRDRRVG